MQHRVLFLDKLYLRGPISIANKENSLNFALTKKIIPIKYEFTF